MMRLIGSSLILLILPTLVLAQAERYELGRRLKRFETEWDKQTDPVVRQRAASMIPEITPMFFSLRFGDAGKTLDQARWALAGRGVPTPVQLWAESLYAIPEKTLYTTEKEVVVAVRPFYTIKIDTPANVSATLRWNEDSPVDVPLSKFPVKRKFKFPDDSRQGVARIQFTVKIDGVVVSDSHQPIAYAADLAADLVRFREFSKRTPVTIETATIQDRIELLEELADGTIPETDLPGLALLEEARTIERSTTYFTADRPGEFWMSIPLEKRKTQPLRVRVPKGLDAKKPVPVVLALHGAGGSENLFFEGYGAGYIVKECDKRGWLLVASRSGISFGSGPPVQAILDQLGGRYPIDRSKIFIVGHSMGAAQTVAICQQFPKVFASGAALGGGGRANASQFPKIPFFIGVGDKDFALSGAKALAKSLPDATYKEYPGLEHLLIVREALPDVFAIWDRLAGNP